MDAVDEHHQIFHRHGYSLRRSNVVHSEGSFVTCPIRLSCFTNTGTPSLKHWSTNASTHSSLQGRRFGPLSQPTTNQSIPPTAHNRGVTEPNRSSGPIS